MRCTITDTFRVRYGFVAAFVILAAALTHSPAAGQGSGASIIGQVTDESGAVLPGVTVTGTSPALQMPQVTAVTNELGETVWHRYRSACLTSRLSWRGFGRPSVRMCG